MKLSEGTGYIQTGSERIRFSSCYFGNLKNYRVFFIFDEFPQEKFRKIYEVTRKPFFILRIDEEDISVIARQRQFLEAIPGKYFVSLHLQECKQGIETPWDPRDVSIDTEFFCEIGKTFVSMMVMIEPAPYGNSSCSHFHTLTTCPKTRIVEVPESDRCTVTELPCPFQWPLSKFFATKQGRQKEYGIRILQYGAYFEYYTQLRLIECLKQKGIEVSMKKLPRMTLSGKIHLLRSLDFIDETTYSKMMDVKKERDKLAHEAKPYHSLYDLEDARAIAIIRKAEECLDKLSRQN